MHSIDKLHSFLSKPNIAVDLSQETLDAIGQRCLRDFDLDKASRSEWEDLIEKGMKLALQVLEEKSSPWPKCANVKYPLITVAAMQFAARAYPELIQGNNVVKTKVVGKDPQGLKSARAARVRDHMNYQVLEEMDGWEEDTDKLLHGLPITGTWFKKTYFDSLRGINVSEGLSPLIVVVNNKARSLDTTRRISHILPPKYANDIYENIASQIWIDAELEGMGQTEDNDEDPSYEFIEQHRFWDLDDDGYEEPYIVTFHKDTGKVVRMVCRFGTEGIQTDENGKIIRIQPDQYFTKYSFIPSVDGSFYDIGFGTLLYPINESVNTTINQLLDAGTLANRQGGFIARGIKIKGGVTSFSPGEWKMVDSLASDLRAGVFPLPLKEPSQVLFALLGMLIQAGKEISTVKDVMTGEKPGENVSASTVLALIEQGLKVFTGIYKRIYRSLASEFKKLFVLNSQYLEDQVYYRILDDEDAKQAGRSDYNFKDCDVIPVADPNLSLDIQRLAKSEALLQISGRPGVNEDEITRRYIEAIKVPNPETLMLPQEQRQTPPDPKMIEIQNRIEIDQVKLHMEMEKFELERKKLFAEIEQLRTSALLSIAKAESLEPGQQLEEYKARLDEMEMQLKHEQTIMKIASDERKTNIQQQSEAQSAGASQQGNVPTMEGTSSNENGIQESTGNP